MKLKITPLALTAAAGAAAAAAVLFAPAAALAYASMADCESYEGAGKCGYCPQGTGDPGYHTKSACGTALAVKETFDRRVADSFAKLQADEKMKVARVKEKAR